MCDLDSKGMDLFRSFEFAHAKLSCSSHLLDVAEKQSTRACRTAPVLSSVDPAETTTLPLSTWATCAMRPYSSATAIVPLVAARVSLPESLRIVPLTTVLPPDVAAVYSDSGSRGLFRPLMEKVALDIALPLQPPRVAGSRAEYVKLIRRLKEQGMISFTARPKAVNGIFAVEKDSQSDRLIIDAQPANRHFVDSPHVQLPDPSHLVQLQVPAGATMEVGRTDLSNFYHHMGLPAWMQPYFALPSLTDEELREIGCADLSASFPMCVTLPMGFSHAVYLAQAAHEHVVYQDGVLDRDDNVLRLASPTMEMDRAYHGIYIDDFFHLCLSHSLAERIQSRVIAAYRRAGFVVKESKVVNPTSEPVKVLGLEICGASASIGLSPEAKVDLMASTLSVLQTGVISGYRLSQLIGSWTWCLLVRRSALSALQRTYHFIEVSKRRKFTLWPSVRRELWMLLGLLPLMEARFDAPFFHRAVATDASELAAGIVTTSLTPALQQRLWPLCSTPHHAVLQAIADKVELTSSPVISSLPVETQSLLIDAVSTFGEFYSSVASCPWTTIVSKRWAHQEHINVLELRVVLLAIHWVLSYPSSVSTRLLCLLDSSVSFFSLWKGRSSSPQLLFVIRKISALLLASGMSLLPGWLPSARNPADAPSRML